MTKIAKCYTSFFDLKLFLCFQQNQAPLFVQKAKQAAFENCLLDNKLYIILF